MAKPLKVVDVESYPNFFLVMFKDLDGGKVTRFQISPRSRLDVDGLLRTMYGTTTIGFNSLSYDLPMILLAVTGATARELKEASDDIVRGMRRGDFAEKWSIAKHTFDHVDLIAVAPGKASLKLYAGRLHCRRLQDLPYDPNEEIDAAKAAEIARYCENDLDNTIELFRELGGQIKLREELSRKYRQDLRSLSDPQVAEAIVAAEVARIDGSRPRRPQSASGTRFRYKMPTWIDYRSEGLRNLKALMLETDFVVTSDGSVEMPEKLSGLAIRVGGGTYRVGIGGLHSSETAATHLADDDTLLIDRDVASYYPSIILTQGLYPKHVGPSFLEVYRDIVRRRLAAKKAGDKVEAESLKVAVNGTFGKLGNQYSVIYSPDLMIQITMTGQLALLALVERVEDSGIDVVSANTDGLVIRCPRPREKDLAAIVAGWEKDSGFVTEETRYRAVYSKDVNNYIAIKEDGSTKNKGLYSNPWEKEGPNVFKLQKNPNATIVIEAVVAHLRDAAPLYYTISRCRDVRKFVSVRTVTGGAEQNGRYLGKVVRWYLARGGGIINYRKTGNKVPKTEGARPLMELPDEFPSDVNFDAYVREAEAMLYDLGVTRPRLF